MIWFASICLVACLVALVVHYWRDFSRVTEAYPRPWLLRWLRRGVVAPILVWALLNVGKMPMMPPLTKNIAHLRGSGVLDRAFVAQVCLATLVIVSFWAVLSFSWFMAGLFKRAKNGDDLIIAAIVWGPVLLPLGWIFHLICGWSGTGFGVLFWVWPLAHYLLNVADLSQPAPTYSKAIAKMKFGKYREAELAIIAQLENCETDFDSWMMLADLYAHQFHDLTEAEKAICDLCDEPTTTLPQMSIALHRLADWQLNLRSDPAAARRVLEEIGRRMPGSHLAMMARHRINNLPESVRELQEQQKPRTVALPAAKANFNEPAKSNAPPVAPAQALAAADQLVEELKADPDDISAREKLAKIFAGQLGKPELAVEQLELLIGMPRQLPAKTAEWLGLIAEWQIQYLGEGEGVKKTFERLIHDFPQSPQAFTAQRRLSLMNVKTRGRKPERVDEESTSGQPPESGSG